METILSEGATDDAPSPSSADSTQTDPDDVARERRANELYERYYGGKRKDGGREEGRTKHEKGRVSTAGMKISTKKPTTVSSAQSRPAAATATVTAATASRGNHLVKDRPSNVSTIAKTRRTSPTPDTVPRQQQQPHKKGHTSSSSSASAYATDDSYRDLPGYRSLSEGEKITHTAAWRPTKGSSSPTTTTSNRVIHRDHEQDLSRTSAGDASRRYNATSAVLYSRDSSPYVQSSPPAEPITGPPGTGKRIFAVRDSLNGAAAAVVITGKKNIIEDCTDADDRSVQTTTTATGTTTTVSHSGNIAAGKKAHKTTSGMSKKMRSSSSSAGITRKKSTS